MKISTRNILIPLLFAFYSCSNSESNQETNSTQPEFCDCVNKDYHQDGDKEKCDKIETELKQKLKTVSKEEKGEILMKIQDCKVAGQYDND